MLALALSIGAFVSVVLMGGAVLSLLGTRRSTRHHAKADAGPPSRITVSGPAFTALDMAPFEMRWPSEIPREPSGVPEPPWPSTSWDDAYFGHDAAPASVAPRSHHPTRTSTAPPSDVRPFEAMPVPTREPPLFESGERTDAAPPLPSPGTLIELARTQGLANAVARIRRDTGWDFATAAQHLAEILRNQ